MVYLILSALLTAALLLGMFPKYPETLIDWMLLFLLAIPIVLVGELLGEFLFRNRLTKAVEHRTQATPFSWLRILYVLGVTITAIATVLLIATAWR
jgi:hypothetical protein